MVVQHNLSALNTYRMLNITSGKKAKSSEKLSSGYRINRSADDAAGLQISEKMRAQIRGLNQGARNTQDGISFVQVGDGAMNEIQAMLHRMTELSVQAANDTNTEEDRLAIDEEMQEIKKEIIRIGNTTKFNDINVFDNNSVQMGLEGSPNDLEIFNATVTKAGDIETYGGFVFHEERVPWSDINKDMVKVVDGKEVFVAGTYEYTTPKHPVTNEEYYFEFYCEDGAELPLITRKISIEADKDGIVLGRERFGWDQVKDLNGKSLSEDNLHGGPWTVDYYGAKLIFTVGEPVESIESLAADVDSKKSATVYYDWEGEYGFPINQEDALKLVTKDVKDDVTYDNTSYNRVNQKSVDAMYDSSMGICYTVGADETGVWLQDNKNQVVSKKTWEQFGITNWNDGCEIPEYTNGQLASNYVYYDPDTKLEFTFDLSNVTDREGVIKSLDGMKLYQMPNDTTYRATLDSTASNSNVNVTFEDDILKLNFNEEYLAKRDFEDEDWSMQGLSAEYNEADAGFTLSYSNNGAYKLSGTLSNLENQTDDVVSDYVSWVVNTKKDALINKSGSTSVEFANYTGDTIREITTTLNSHTYAEESIKLKYTYDYANKLAGIENNINVSLDALTDKTDLVSNKDLLTDARYEYYVEHDGKFQTTRDLILTNKLTVDEVLQRDICTFNYTFNTANGTLTDEESYKNDQVVAFKKEVGQEIATATKINLTAQTFSTMNALKGTNNESKINRPAYEHKLIETPVQPDLWIQHSSQQYDRTGIPRFAMNTVSMGLTFTNARTREDAVKALDSVSKALKYVSDKRSYYGALQNRLEHTMNNVKNTSENTTAAESRIRDTDMAAEMVEFSKNNILAQAGQSMLAQANQLTQGVLSLLQ